MDEGVPTHDPRAMDASERQRLLIDMWFYTCPHEMHEHLGRMYVEDARLTATYERIRPGMARLSVRRDRRERAAGAAPERGARGLTPRTSHA